MPGPYKGYLTQHTTQQQYAKSRHQPSDRDQRARDRLRNKVSAFQAKVKIPAYIALGATALQTVYQTFDPDFPVTFHLPKLTTETATNTTLTVYVIQKDRHCMPTSDYYFTNIQPDPIIIPPHRGNNSSSTPQQVAAKDPIPQQTDTLKPGETRVYPSMLAEKQVPVLDLTDFTITSAADLQTAFHSLCPTKKEDPSHGRNNPPQKKTPTDYISDSESSDEELNQHLCTSEEERFYDTIKGSAQATQAALSYNMAQCNPTVERGPDRKPKIKPLPKEKAKEKTTQTPEKDKSK